MEDLELLRAAAAELRVKSDVLNREMHGDITDSERDAIAAEKRDVDARAFDFEQRVRALEEAEYGPDVVSTRVDAPSLSGGI